MARKTGQSASPTARPRKGKDTSTLSTPAGRGATKKSTLVTGKRASTGRSF